MKKTQRKDAFRNIRKRLVSYLSVCLVIMLGLGGLFTTRYMGAGIQKQATEYYNAHNFKVFDLASTYGISEANIEKIRSAEAVKDAEGVIQAAGSVYFRGKKRNAIIISLTESVSVPDVAEGRLPAGKDECMIGEDFAEIEGIKVGDRLSISLTGLASESDRTGNVDMEIDMEGADTEENDEKKETGSSLYSKEFTITGLMHHPDFLRRKSDNTVSLPLSAFNTEVTEGLYTNAFVSIEQPENVSIFKKAFTDQAETVRLSLEELAEELEEDRTQEVKDKAHAYIDEEWEKAEARLRDAQDEIDSNEAELNARLADGRKKLNDARKQLERETARYEKLFRDSDKTIAEKEKELNAGKKQLAQKKSELARAKREVAKGKKQLAKKEKELKEGKEQLAEVKEAIKTAKEMLGGEEEIERTYETFKKIKALSEDIDKRIEEGEDAQEKVKELGTLLLENKKAVKTIFDIAADPDTAAALKLVGKDKEKELKKDLEAINAYGYDNFIEDATKMKETGDLKYYQNMKKPLDSAIESILLMVEQLKEAEASIADKEKQIKDGEAKIAAAKKELKEFEAEIAKGEKTIAKYEKQIKEGEKLLNQKKKELEKGKSKFAAEKAKSEKKIRAGWDDYYKQKARYETKIEEAIALLQENRELAEEKLAEARAEADSIERCDWVVLDRNSNAGYLDIKSNIDAVDIMGVIFGILFAIITAIVCFSTLVIIIDEQKPMVGTAKAFGFYRREVLGKYLVFGVSAAIVGSILAIIGGFILSEFVQKKFAEAGIYPIGLAKSIITPGPTVMFSLLITAVTVAATVIACSDILRSPAAMLMKGAVLRKNKQKKEAKAKKKTASKSGSLYSRLIIRNMIQDKARVSVTIAIIAFSCMLIGLGISLKFAYNGMMDGQESVVNRFDIRMDMNDDVSDEDEEALARVLEENKAGFMPAAVESTLYRWNNRLDGVSLICADPEKISEFYGVVDPKTGKDIELPENGILIQKRMHESYGMDPGDNLTVLDSSLREHDAEIRGTFVNYVGRTIVTSQEAYRSIFGKDSDANCYFIKLNGADREKLEEELLAVSDNISFEANNEFRTEYEAGTIIYDILVFTTTGIAILISFMILTNLANIYLTRKKTELTIMRVNGFRIKEAKGYLSRESILTTVAGLALGVAVGAVFTPFAINYMQQPDLEFVKTFQPVAWMTAVVLEALFSIVINTLVYRKVKDLNLRDIA